MFAWKAARAGASVAISTAFGGFRVPVAPDGGSLTNTREEDKRMNRTGIEWTDYTWNPITGCSRNCKDTNDKPYCYARRIAYRLRGRAGYPQKNPFAPTFHPDRLHEPTRFRAPSKIFVCSMGELFDRQNSPLDVRQVLDETVANPRHTFQILTKQAALAQSWPFPENVWLGCSQDGLTTDIGDVIHVLKAVRPGVRFVSFEPLLGPIERLPDIWLYRLEWFIIGAQTGPGAVPPKREWVQGIIDMAHETGAAVFLKDNLHWPVKIQEFPREAHL